MNGVVCGVLCADNIIRIEYAWIVVDNILIGYWIDVMDDNRTEDLKSFNTQVTSIVANNNFIAKSQPLV